ncbi:hypothetical protein GCM10011374_17700 [Kocuria dechangensis]|uniref:Cardiolipin synthase N-terminal domain-containing protein n=1 Tax=Kocuria dechangensis TaxID=1176249 RepID=A0A917GSD8_9MICC|nr:PLDc N-terminal domain-containing protein [Kocuria dechangensis]GGG55200.1 hypothetical protein GCM10011374_17700 [Kocuria dechangensis]
MGRAILIIGAAALAVGVIVYSLIECARTSSADMRGLRKGGWIAVILLLPLLGALLWLFLGRPQGSGEGGRSVRPRGPDDDPQFLRNLEERRRQKEQAEKLRRWEEQLKRNGGSGAAGRPGDGSGKPPAGDSDKDHEKDLDKNFDKNFDKEFEQEFGQQFGEEPDEGPADGLPDDTSDSNRPPRD